MRNIQEKECVYVYMFWIGNNRCLFCTHVYKSHLGIFSTKLLILSPILPPDLFPEKFPLLSKWQLFFRVLYDFSLNPIFDPSVNSVGFFFQIYLAYDHFSWSSWLSMSLNPPSFMRLQAYLGGIVTLDHCARARIATKWVIIFVLVEGLAFSLWTMQHLWGTMKQSTMKRGQTVLKQSPELPPCFPTCPPSACFYTAAKSGPLIKKSDHDSSVNASQGHLSCSEQNVKHLQCWFAWPNPPNPWPHCYSDFF